MKDISIWFPGFNRKAISFTIDDGNVVLDKKFLDIVRPAGIRGTFNIVGNIMKNRKIPYEEIRAFYNGYEVSNHCNTHPFAINPDVNYEIVEADAEIIPSRERLHKTETKGVYAFHYLRDDKLITSHIADADTYIKYIEEGKKDVEEIFGEGTVKAFVWPYGEQQNPQIHEYLKNSGYESVRRTGCDGFDLPEDRMRWSYCANYTNLIEKAEDFENIADDGKLRWFCFGVHSHDFENNNCWHLLIKFVEDFGNRPEDFWYATVHDVFEYEDAAKSLVYTDEEIINNSKVDVYLTIDGKRTTLMAGARVKI